MPDQIEGFKLSPQQRKVWLLMQDSPAYLAQFALLIEQKLNAEALEKSLKDICHHQSLRTTFHRLPEMKVPVQIVSNEPTLFWQRVSVRSEVDEEKLVENLLAEQRNLSFDFERGPLVRTLLVELSEIRHILLLTLPSLCADEQTLKKIIEQIGQSYALYPDQRDVSEEVVQYPQFAEWQNQLLEEEENIATEYCSKLDTSSCFDARLPFEKKISETSPFAPEVVSITLPDGLQTIVSETAYECGHSVSTFLLACWHMLIWRLIHKPHIVVAILYDCRVFNELEDSSGLFSKYLPIQSRLSGDSPVKNALAQVAEETETAGEWQEYFFPEKIVEETGQNRDTSFFSFGFDYEDLTADFLTGSSFSLISKNACFDRFKIRLSCRQYKGHLKLQFYYDSALYRGKDIAHLADQFSVLIQSVAANPEARIGDLNILTIEQQKRLIADFNDTEVVYPFDKTIHGLIEDQSRRTPDSIAIQFGEQRLTYQELSRRSNQLANYLQSIGAGCEVTVGILLDRSPAMVTALLGVLKAGAAYVPLDPVYPLQRIQFILDNAQAAILLTDEQHAFDYTHLALQVLRVDSEWEAVAQMSFDEPYSETIPDSLAYVMYTSGSTGQPKGVMISHKGLVNYLSYASETYRVAEAECAAVHSSIGFDLTVTSLFSPLMVGRSVILLPDNNGAESLAAALKSETRFSIVKVTPAHLLALEALLSTEENIPNVKVLIVGGEALFGENLSFWRKMNPSTRIINEYGPTETVVGSCVFECPAGVELSGSVPIGKPIANTRLYVLDEDLQPVSTEIAGELFIGGSGVARGYLGSPDLTAEKFMPDPLSSIAGDRIHRTGDMAHFLLEGILNYAGRCDDMVKIRGYRIEPGEIEAVIKKHPAVRDAAVVVREDIPGINRLAAYVALNPRYTVSTTEHNICELPNQIEIAHLNKNETDLLYQDIFEHESYLKHGITLDEGACIFDVGANIGLFSLFVHRRFKNISIYAFEPVPPIFEVLNINQTLHNLNAKLFECGLSDEAKTATITYYPRMSAMSGLYAEAQEDEKVARTFLSNQDRSLTPYADEFMDGRFKKETFQCRLRTISEVMREEGLDHIDLLKLDVEKSEMDVLAGIKDEDWQMIRQITIEVHDINGRLEKLTSLLENKGYSVAIEQETLLENTHLFNVYAVSRSHSLKTSQSKGNGSAHSLRSFNRPVLSITELQRFVSKSLPDYMLPSAFVIMDSLPLTSNGKIDRRALPEPDQIRSDSRQTFVEPRTPIEQTLSQIWSSVLGVTKISVNDNFFELGGDSILSIQIVTRADQVGLRITPKQMFQYQTIAKLAEAVSEAPLLFAQQDMVTGDVPLTAVQRWFFEQALPDAHHYNQSVLLQVNRPVDAELLRRALEALLAHHDALRLQFEKQGSEWRQINRKVDSDVSIFQVDLSDLSNEEQSAAIECAAAGLQASLDLAKGSLVKVTLFSLGNKQPDRILFVVHHLVVDSVSWRLLVEDIESAYDQLSRSQTVTLPRKTTSFKQWSEKLQEFAQGSELLEELDYWTSSSLTTVTPLPVDYPEGVLANTIESSRDIEVSLTREETQLLLHQLPGLYHTQINEVLLSALLLAFSRWTQSNSLLINLEAHGREDILDNINILRTVGWFTSLFPVLLHTADPSDARATLISVKEHLRRVPNHGVGYGLLRYLSNDENLVSKLHKLAEPQVSFNYLGQFDSILSPSSFFSLAPERSGPPQSPAGARPYLLEINGRVTDGCFTSLWTYSANIHRHESIAILASEYIAALRRLIEDCRHTQEGIYSPRDFPLADLNQNDLDMLARRFSFIEDIYPLSATQQGLLFHTLYTRDSRAYSVCLSCAIGGSLDIDNFKKAWQAVVGREQILRTSFVWDGVEKPVQVVCTEAKLKWQEYDWRDVPIEERDSRLEELLEEARKTPFDVTQAPLMNMTLVQTLEAEHHFVWTFHHLLLDGWSMPLLLKEVLDTYESFEHEAEVSLPDRRPYRDYIKWLQKQDLSEAEKFWRSALSGFKNPRLLQAAEKRDRVLKPHPERRDKTIHLSEEITQALKSTARGNQLTLNTMVQGAWAILLHYITSEQVVVFGSTVAGRPVDLSGSQSMIGLFINTLPVRVNVFPDSELIPWLKQIQAQQIEINQYEYSPLVDVQKWSGVSAGQPLFESILVFENYPVEVSLKELSSTLIFDRIRSVDPSHYPMTLMAAPGERMMLRLTYDRNRFNELTINRILVQLEVALTAFVNCSDLILSMILDALTDAGDSYDRNSKIGLEQVGSGLLKRVKRKAVREEVELDGLR